MFQRPSCFARSAIVVGAFALAVALAAPALANPTVGFVESFAGAGNLAGWDGGATYSNPGTGGVGGAADGYLVMARSGFAGRLGVKSQGAAYVGDWLAAGADRVKFSLNDVGADQNLEIHFCIGNVNNFWQYDVGFIPPNGAWSEFTVNLADSANFSHIISFDGTGYRFALATADRVLIRHDTTPYVQTPNAILGEVGIDEFKIESTTVGVGDAPIAAGRGVLLAPPFPNPSRGAATFAFESFDDAPVTIAIYDARGRAVRRAVVAGAPGRRSWAWDGLDEAGRSTPAGVYRVRAWGPAGGTSRALVRVD